MEGLSQAVVRSGGVSVSQEEQGPGASSPLVEKAAVELCWLTLQTGCPWSLLQGSRTGQGRWPLRLWKNGAGRGGWECLEKEQRFLSTQTWIACN